MKPDFFTGAGGGGGGGSRNIPDNLRSTDSFEALIGVVSGPIKGLTKGGLQNLFVNGVQVEDSSGRSTLTDFSASLFNGDPATLQPISLQLGGSSGPKQVNQNINNDDTTGRNVGEWRYASIDQSDCDFIDCRFVVQQLYQSDKNGSKETTATLEIELQATGMTSWYNPLSSSSAPAYSADGLQDGVFSYYLPQSLWSGGVGSTTWANSTGRLTIRGKTTSPFVKELRIGVPKKGAWAGKSWQVRVRLIERDEYNNGSDKSPQEEYRKISWESIAGVKTDPIGNDEAWRGLAYLHILGKASDQITGVPDVYGIYDLAMPKCPPATVWNAETRAYTGAPWDGATYQITWTQCPAWLISNFIEDDLSGVAALAPGARLNKWDTLEASKWFGELVPDGKGGMHPRYSLNYLFDQPLEVDEAVNYLAGAVNAFAWDQGDGDWRLVAEKPENPVAIFTEENIVGEFSYSHTDVDSRFNDITGIFLDEERGTYEETRVRVFDQADIDANGRRPTTITLVGCTNRQEALRRLNLRLLSSLRETKVSTFTTNRQGRLLKQFSVIAVADASLGEAGKKTTGRILDLSSDRTQIGLRDPIRLELGVEYSIQVTTPNPNYTPEPSAQPTNPSWNQPTIVTQVKVVNTAGQRGDVYNLYLEQALPANTPANANFSLVAPGLPAIPKQYRVMGLTSSAESPEFVTVSAMEVFTSKWALSDAITEEAINAQRPDLTVHAPTVPGNGTVLSVVNSYFDGTPRPVVQINWGRPAGTMIDGYQVSYGINDGPMSPPVFTRELTFEVPQPSVGNWRVEVRTVDRRKILSDPLTAGLLVTSDLLSSLAQLQDQVDNLYSDGVITKGREKRQLRLDWDGVTAQFDALEARYLALDRPANATDAYNAAGAARNALSDYLTGLVPSWADTTEDTPIDAGTWAARWGDVTSTLATLSAAITGQKGDKGDSGQSAYTVVLSNEAVVLPADSNGNILSYGTAATSIQVFFGATDVTDMFSTVLDEPANQNPQSLSVTGTYPNFQISDGFDANEPSARFTFKLNGSGPHAGVTLGKTINLTKSRQAVDGTSPPLITLTGSGQVFTYDATNTVRDGIVTLTAAPQNSGGAVQWRLLRYDGVALTDWKSAADFVGTGAVTRALDGLNVQVEEDRFQALIAQNGGLQFTYQVRIQGSDAVDTFTIFKIRDGSNGTNGVSALSGYLTNETVTLPADAAGNVASYEGAAGKFVVMVGTTDVTDQCVFAIAGSSYNGAAFIAAINGSAYSCTNLAQSLDNAWVDYRATYNGASITKRFTISKSKGGANGAPAALITITATSQVGKFDANDNYTGTGIDFTATHQNFTGNYGFQLIRVRDNMQLDIRTADQYGAAPGAYYAGSGGATFRINALGVGQILAAHGSFRVVAYSDGQVVNDSVTVVRVNDGEKGEPGLKGDSSYTHYAYADSADGRTNFGLGSPNGRTWEGRYVDNTPADSDDPAKYTWKRYAGPVFGMDVRGTASMAGNVIAKSAGSSDGWDSDAYSTVGYKNGAIVRGRLGPGSHRMFGLNTDPLTDTSYGSLDFAWYGADNAALIYENGNGFGPVFTGLGNYLHEISYDGRYVKYAIGSNVYRTLDIGPGYTFYFDSSLSTPGSRITDVSFDRPASKGSAITLIPDTPGTEVYANSVQFLGGGGWGAGHVHSLEGYAGAVVATWTIPPDDVFGDALDNTTKWRDGSCDTMAGLSLYPTYSNSYDQITFAIHRNNAGQIACYSNGSILPSSAIPSANPSTDTTKCRIFYDGATKVEYWVNDTLVYTQPQGASNAPLYFEAALASTYPRLYDITLTPAGKKGVDALSAVLTNETFTVPTDANGGYSSFPIELSRGNMQVFYGGVNVTAQCAFTVQNPYQLGSDINAAGAYYCNGLYGDTGYSYIIASYNGMSVTKTLTATKSKGGANGADAPLITLTASSLTLRRYSDGTLIPGQPDFVFTANRKNLPGGTSWGFDPGHQAAGAPGVTINGDTMTVTASRMWDMVTYDEGNLGFASVKVVCASGSQTDVCTVVGVDRGANGANAVGVTVSCSSATATFDASGALQTPSTATFTASRSNTSNAVVWRMYTQDGTNVGNGQAVDYVASWGGDKWTSTDNDHLTLTQAGITYFLRDLGYGTVTMRAEVSGVQGSASISKVVNGAAGAPGAPGANAGAVTKSGVTTDVLTLPVNNGQTVYLSVKKGVRLYRGTDGEQVDADFFWRPAGASSWNYIGAAGGSICFYNQSCYTEGQLTWVNRGEAGNFEFMVQGGAFGGNQTQNSFVVSTAALG